VVGRVEWALTTNSLLCYFRYHLETSCPRRRVPSSLGSFSNQRCGLARAERLMQYEYLFVIQNTRRPMNSLHQLCDLCFAIRLVSCFCCDGRHFNVVGCHLVLHGLNPSITASSRTSYHTIQNAPHHAKRNLPPSTLSSPTPLPQQASSPDTPQLAREVVVHCQQHITAQRTLL